MIRLRQLVPCRRRDARGGRKKERGARGFAAVGVFAARGALAAAVTLVTGGALVPVLLGGGFEAMPSSAQAMPLEQATQPQATQPQAASIQAAQRRAALADGTPQLYSVATAHLDTQWRWTIKKTIDEFLPATLDGNFALFESYPGYTFSFEGAFRYMLMREYYPERFERLRGYIAAGRWRVAGSWIDAVDTNIPSPESLIRHALYGNGYFAREFGVRSRDLFLPDCFGFGYALPSIAAHCGILGFSTQKLTWGSAVGIPFDIGLWQGLDGSLLVAAVNPGSYVARLDQDQSRDSLWVARAGAQADSSGLPIAYRYFGTGDSGGAPTEGSVAQLEASMASDGPLAVRSAASDDLARDLTADLPADLARGLRPEIAGSAASTSWMKTLAAEADRPLVSDGSAARGALDASGPRGSIEPPPNPALARLQALPRYDGELLMTRHGVGCYTSQSAMKRWNRQNERLADAAERLSVMADWVGVCSYPRQILHEAWVRFLWHQFHDDLTGTSIPEAYVYSWNDEILSLNQFAEVLTCAAAGMGSLFDTRVAGEALLVYNALAAPREEIVAGRVRFEGSAPEYVRVFGPDGQEVPAQVLARDEEGLQIAFLGRMPPLSLAVYDVRPSADPPQEDGGLTVSPTHLENWRYRVELNRDGDIARVFDKRMQREMIRAPLRLELLDNSPRDWAAWEIDYDDISAAPRTVVAGPAEIRILERGPARVALEILRRAEGSTFRQTIRLATAGAGVAIPVDLEIDWRTTATLLKAAFPLAIENERAAYDLGVGAIERATNRPDLYEVPAQQWADMTSDRRDYGVTVLSDCRYGWDKPDDHTLRLTLLHTPEVNPGWGWIADENTQDLGRHHLRYGLYGHRGTWRHSNAHWVADGFAQPLFAFQVPKHPGPLGSRLSFVRIRTVDGHAVPQAAVAAVKLAEASDEIVIRLQERAGLGAREALVEFAKPVVTAREVNGAEEPVPGEALLDGGALQVSLAPYQTRSFAIRLEALPVAIAPMPSVCLDLPFNLDGVSRDEDRRDGDFSGAGHSLVGEQLPARWVREDVPFVLGACEPGARNMLACDGQILALPEGEYDALYMLAATVDGEREVEFGIEPESGAALRVPVWIQDYAEPIAQWDSRIRGRELIEDPAQIVPAYIKRQPVAWVGTHRHGPAGENEAYQFTYLFKHRLPLPAGAGALRLPRAPGVRIAAITAVQEGHRRAVPISPLYDAPERSCVRIDAPLTEFVDSASVVLSSPNRAAVIHFTLDGAQPTRESARYAGAIQIRDDALLKARAFAPGLTPEFVAEAAFRRLTPQAPVAGAAGAAGGLARGLDCQAYRGAWESLPDFTALAPVASWTAATIDLPETLSARLALPDEGPPEDFGLLLRGYIEVPRTGLYTFHLWSDDGSRMWVNGEPLIDNDGLHGNQDVRAHVALEAGLHRLEVQFFQHLGDAALDLTVAGPGLALQAVPAEWLWHDNQGR